MGTVTGDEGAPSPTAAVTTHPSTADSLLAVTSRSGDPAPDRSVPGRGDRGRPTDTAPGVAAWVFAVGEAVALAFYLWVGRGIWFNGDEWDFLTNRSAGSLHDLFTPHSQHWSTLPILVYRFWWQVIGLRSYTPYLASVVVLHLAVAALLRTVMRRSGVSAWVATTAALVFAFFGSGYFDIIYGFQIGFCGALAFGLVFLLAADHDGPFGRRDLWGLLAGLASLMCSGVGVTMVVVVAAAVLMRRGWRMALAHALPLAAVYLIWFAWIGHIGYPPAATPGQVVHFAATAAASTFSALGHGTIVGVLLAALLVAGGTLAWKDTAPDRRRRQLAAPVGLLVGAVVFAVVTGAGRGAPPLGVSTGDVAASRYLHVIAALSITALAVAADAVIARWRYATPVVLAVLLVGVPGNIAVAVAHGRDNRATAAFFRPFILTLPRLPVATVIPPATHPDPYFDPVMTMSWLLAGVAQGRIPSPPATVTARDRATWTLGLALQPTKHRAPSCADDLLPTTLTVERGDTLTVSRGAAVTLVASPTLRSAPRVLGGYVPGATYLAYQDMVLLAAPAGGNSITVCRTIAP
jgi:hypothetical protein